MVNSDDLDWKKIDHYNELIVTLPLRVALSMVLFKNSKKSLKNRKL
ncbi:hypothetical protein DESC_370110 [Desulfosarcina cetonica]|nr:hypothetical protein DESC_370110 [Desulfosarcina cetonica]